MIRLLLAFALFATPAWAQEGRAVGPNPTAVGQAATGQIPGTATNDNASAGNIGEYRSASNADTGQAQGSATVTITIASPAVITWGTTVPFVFNGTGTAVINFTTSGALPTGIVAGTNYYAFNVVGNTFNIATSADNAIAGTAINTSGTQSGTQTGVPTAILATAITAVVAAMSLTAGDWDISGNVGFLAAGTTSITSFSVFSNTAAGTSNIPGRATQNTFPASIPGVSNNIVSVGPGRYSLGGTTTVYLISLSAFGVSTMATWGGFHARRVR